VNRVRRLDAVHFRHRQVEDDEIRLDLLDLLEGLGARGCLG